MQLFIVLAACFAAAFAQSPAKKLEETLISIRDQMPCGFPDWGIPPLAPLQGDYFNLYHKLWILQINGGASDFLIEGLNDFDISNVNLNVLTLKLNMDLNFNKIHAKGKYFIESFIISPLKLKGKGTFDINLTDLSIKIYGRIGMVDGILRLMDLDVVIGLDGMKSKITGLVGPLGTLVLSSIVDKVIVGFIADNQEALTDNIREILLPQINNLLKDFTISDVLQLLQNSPEFPPCVAKAA